MDNPAQALESVIATGQLRTRPGRPSGPSAEFRLLARLTEALAKSPQELFPLLVKTVLELSGAGSAGISLLNEKKGRFVWPAVAGKLDCYLGSGTPADFGPCGTVLDRNASILFIHPERHFTYLEPISPPLEEVLLIPFHVDEKAVGTIWAVIHDKDREFSETDRHLLESLSAFASAAYRTLANSGALAPLLEMEPQNP
jgi:GAF domain-containing protein